MGNGIVSKEKVMLPASMMKDPVALKRWVGIAFKAAAALPAKQKKAAKTASKPAKKQTRTKSQS